MIVLIPLGGIGDRFKKNGYTYPKALVKIFGKPILYYLLDSINLKEDNDFVYIVYNKEYEPFRFESQIRKDYPKMNLRFLKLEKNTDGAAETISIALSSIEKDTEDQPVLCLDGDNFYSIDIVNRWDKKNNVFVVEDLNDNPIYSYIKNDEHTKKITDIVEKNKISNYACTGAYGFESYKQLLYYSLQLVERNVRQLNEFYTSSVIREMIKVEHDFRYTLISFDNWHCLGTPFQVKMFYNNLPRFDFNNKEIIKPMRICFDLDNTLVSFPKVKDDYTTVEPIQRNIDYLRYLKTFGNTIIIYTARRMKTHNGNVGKIIADIGKITIDTLERFNIPYDELYFWKPEASVYIDDLALNCCTENMEKTLGFYMDIVQPRSFNDLKTDVIETYVKRSTDLSGEIHYYTNIPKKIKDLFPILIDYDDDKYEWYKMEKINGLTATSLYLNEMLTPDNLKNIMNSIQRIHSTDLKEEEENKDDILDNIYNNYSYKLMQRYEQFDYSVYENSNDVYRQMFSFLKMYETRKMGKRVIVHGDPVLTNVLINQFGKIKFIDMRGKVGDTLTIYGDWLYDWSKLYQSLIGYDEILQNKTVSMSYKNLMITTFETYFISLFSKEDLDNVKQITKFLLFTLIPLHYNENKENDKCLKYYNLINLIK